MRWLIRLPKRDLSHVDYLSALTDGEAALRRQRSIKRRIKLARFPVGQKR